MSTPIPKLMAGLHDQALAQSEQNNSHVRLPKLSPVMSITAVIIGIAMHALNWPTHPFDFDDYLLPWYFHILSAGPVAAFTTPFSNYTPFYLYLLAGMTLAHPLIAPFHAIKLLSLLGTLLLGLSFAKLVRAAGVTSRWLVAVPFLVPSVAINGSKLGQCDAYWVAACLFATAAAIQKRFATMLVFAGLAVAFKAQSAFLAPFLFAVLLRQRTPLQLWLIPPAIYALVMLPAWLAGWPAPDLALIYISQSQDLPGFISFAQQPWYILRLTMPERASDLFPVGFGLAIMAAGWIAIRGRKHLRDADSTLLLAILSASLLPYLLPKMHERYWLLADMLALALAVSSRKHEHVVLALLVQLSSVLALLALIHSSHAFMVVAFGLMSMAIALNLRLLAAPVPVQVPRDECTTRLVSGET